jgi:AbiU2
MPNEGDVSKADRILKVAGSAFVAAIDYLKCIELLEAGNLPDIEQSINNAGAGLAGDLVQRALFGRLLIGVMTAYDPPREGDFHLGVGMQLLAEPGARKLILERTWGNADQLEQAENLWARCLQFEALPDLRVYRNKFVAHQSDPPADLIHPLKGELLTLARSTAEVAEQLAAGTGVATTGLEAQVETFRPSARAFWAPWRTN